MTRRTNLAAAAACIAAFALVGCQSTEQFMASVQPKALDAAQKRGSFEMNCPAATAQVLNQQDVPPAFQSVRYSAPDRAVFTIGVNGCGQRATYVVVCPDDGSGNCFAADGRR